MPKTLDPRSDAVILTLTGEEGEPVAGAPDGTPARDLTENDVARLVYERAYSEVANIVGTPIDPDEEVAEGEEPRVHQRPDPRKPDPDIADAIIAQLVATGGYAQVASTSKKAPAAPAADNPPESAGAAETPEA